MCVVRVCCDMCVRFVCVWGVGMSVSVYGGCVYMCDVFVRWLYVVCVSMSVWLCGCVSVCVYGCLYVCVGVWMNVCVGK